jgi:glycosyltransferase involved in cell wall biosynthesis/SAM-dependent methyltransferase
MRVLTALTYYHPHWTGLTRHAVWIAEGLAAAGHSVTVIAAQHTADLALEEFVNGVRVVRVPTVGRLSRTMLMPGLPRAAWRLLGEHDVLHVHSPMPEAALLVALAKLRRVAAVVTHQGDVVMPAGILNRTVQAAMNLNLASAFKRADAVSTLNAGYAASSRQLAARAGRIAAIHPPARIPEPDPAGVAAWRDQLVPEGGPLVGFAGRWVAEKGFDVLMAAVPAVRESFGSVRFAFAGETDVVYETTFTGARPLLDAAGDAVRIVGLLTDRQRLADFYAACDLFVLPSRSDCHPAVQVEALLCGTPVVATDIAGARSVVALTGMGRLVRPADPAALGVGIIAELTHPRARPDRAAVAAIFDSATSIAGYAELLRGAVDGVPEVPPDPDRWRLDAADTATLTGLLEGEPDVYYRRRVPRLIGLLELRDGDTVLDCGAGIGALSRAVKQVRPGVTVVMADGDSRRLAAGRRRGVAAEPVQIDAERLPFADASFDKVLLSEVLEHIGDDLTALLELRRVLKPGGIMAVSVPHARYPWRWDVVGNLRELFGLPPDPDGVLTNQWAGHRRLYLPGELQQLLGRAGFTVDLVEPHTPYTAPLTHLLVYTIGKPLLEHDWLPKRVAESADRFRSDAPPHRFDPVHAAARVIGRFERRNDHPRGDENRFVGVIARVRKPEGVVEFGPA